MAGKVIHRRRLFGGRFTAEEYHQKYAFPPRATCFLCSNRPVERAIVMMELREARKLPEMQVDQLMLVAPERVLGAIVQIKGSSGQLEPYLRISNTYACRHHVREMERAAAKAPSHCIVEFSRGPGPDKSVSGPCT